MTYIPEESKVIYTSEDGKDEKRSFTAGGLIKLKYYK